MKIKSLILFLLLKANLAFAANEGVITRIDFSGSNSTWGGAHSDVVQLNIEGGFDAPNCPTAHAAIRKSETHLVSAALAAFMAGKVVTVQVSNADTYHSGRCIITDLFINK